MKKSKRLTRVLASVLCALMLLCACETAPKEETLKIPQIPLDREASAEDVSAFLNYLTDPALRGRVVGSDGNAQTAQDIAAYFSELGLAPFAEEYGIPYEESLVRLENANASLALIAADGTRTALTEGVDYTYSPRFEAIDVTLPISSDENTALSGETAYLRAEGGKFGGWVTMNGTKDAVAFDVCDLSSEAALFYRINTSWYGEGLMIAIDQRWEELLSQEGTQVEIKLEPCAETGEANNVVAVRRGSVGKTAIIIGAHFDGSGCYGDTIFPSAYDNGSGTATLLLCARLLAQAEVESDLIFAAFNGEELLLHGSGAVAQTLCEGYDSVAMINIDCVGLKDDKATLYSWFQHEQYYPELIDLLGEYDGFGTATDLMPGDHESFYDAGENVYPVMITDLTGSEYHGTLMHSQNDTADLLDPARILHVAQAIAAYVEGGNFPHD